jgi:hypothetical protein
MHSPPSLYTTAAKNLLADPIDTDCADGGSDIEADYYHLKHTAYPAEQTEITRDFLT